MPFGPGPVPVESQLALTAWNLMGGLDWAALPYVADMLGAKDVDALVIQLVAIRKHFTEQES